MVFLPSSSVSTQDLLGALIGVVVGVLRAISPIDSVADGVKFLGGMSDDVGVFGLLPTFLCL